MNERFLITIEVEITQDAIKALNVFHLACFKLENYFEMNFKFILTHASGEREGATAQWMGMDGNRVELENYAAANKQKKVFALI